MTSRNMPSVKILVVLVMIILPLLAYAQNPDTGGYGNDNIPKEETVQSENPDPAVRISKGGDTLITVLLVLTLLSSLLCLYQLYIRPGPNPPDMQSLQGDIVQLRTDNAFSIKNLENLIKKIPTAVTPPPAKETDNTKTLRESLDRIDGSLTELKSMIERTLMDMASFRDQMAPQDLGPITANLKRLDEYQKDILELLSKPKILEEPPRQISSQPIAEPAVESPEAKLEKLIKQILDKFDQWLQNNSRSVHFKESIPIDNDQLISFAPQRNGLWSDYKFVPGNGSKADDFFNVIYERGVKPGIIKRIDRPAVILMKSYGQTETLRKGKIVVYT